MKTKYFQEYADILHSSEYIQIKTWLLKNDPLNGAISEINAAVEHSYSPCPKDHIFTPEAKATFEKVFEVLKKQKR